MEREKDKAKDEKAKRDEKDDKSKARSADQPTYDRFGRVSAQGGLPDPTVTATDEEGQPKLNDKGLVPVPGPERTEGPSILRAEQAKFEGQAPIKIPTPAPPGAELAPVGWDVEKHGEWPSACPVCGAATSGVRDPGGMGIPAGIVGWACSNPDCSNHTGKVFLGDDDPRKLASDEDLSDLPDALQMALPAMGLRRKDILDYKLTQDGVNLVTKGGKKLRWPTDASRANLMTETEKDGIQREPERAPLFNLTGGRG